MFKRGLRISLFLLVLFLVACNNEQEATSDNEQTKDDAKDEAVEEVEEDEGILNELGTVT